GLLWGTLPRSNANPFVALCGCSCAPPRPSPWCLSLSLSLREKEEAPKFFAYKTRASAANPLIARRARRPPLACERGEMLKLAQRDVYTPRHTEAHEVREALRS
ncbi:unnamed protein product, partial [Ectocarpus fasciculatus]